MAEIYLNKDDIETIIVSYRNENDTFVMRSFVEKDNKKRCSFFLNGKDCTIDCYVKNNNKVNILPVGKNITESNFLINFLASKGLSADVKTTQFTFKFNEDILNKLINYIEEECTGLVNFSKNQNIYKFAGYNGDVITLTYFESTQKAMIQGKPLYAFHIITTFLSGLQNFTLEDIIGLNNTFACMNTPVYSIREEMKNKLENAYSYLDEALLKSISGSLTFLKQKAYSEDYTGCLAGEFKALEGYLKKILSTKYQYILSKDRTFNMFYVDKTTQKCELDENRSIPFLCKKELKKLHNIYTNKRNVYLHATVDPSLTRIVSTLKEAQDLSDELLIAIKDSYKIIFA